MKKTEEIAELTQNEKFELLAQEYIENRRLCNELRDEIRSLIPYPRITQLAIDRLLRYHESLIKAEIELASKGLSAEDVFAWQCANIMAQAAQDAQGNEL